MTFPPNDARCEFDFERNGSTKAILKDLIIEEARSLAADRKGAVLSYEPSSSRGEPKQSSDSVTTAPTSATLSSSSSRKFVKSHKESNAALARAREWISATAVAASDCAGEIDRLPPRPPSSSKGDKSNSLSKSEEVNSKLMKTSGSPGKQRREKVTSMATKGVARDRHGAVGHGGAGPLCRPGSGSSNSNARAVSTGKTTKKSLYQNHLRLCQGIALGRMLLSRCLRLRKVQER